MMRLLLRSFGALLLLAAFAPGLQAQQTPSSSQYMLNPYQTNPAFGGSEPFLNLRAGYRNQWTGIGGTDASPTTFYANGSVSLGRDVNLYDGLQRSGAFRTPVKAPSVGGKSKFYHGVGGAVLHDQFGPTQLTQASGSYALHYRLSDHLTLAGGLAAGVFNHSLNWGQLDFEDDREEDFLDGTVNNLTPDINIGLAAYAPHYYFGFSVNQVLGSELEFLGTNPTTSIEVEPGSVSRTYNGILGVNLRLSDRLDLMPSANIVMANGDLLTSNLSARLMYDNLLWVGGNLRAGESVGALAGIHIGDMLAFSYSADFVTGDLSEQVTTSHEVMLQVKIGEYKPHQQVIW